MLVDVSGQPAYAYTGGKTFDAALPTVVFIHGAQHDHSVWILQSRYLAHHGYSVLAVDLPGHGRSGGAALATVEEMADWLLALLAAAGVQKAVLVGHSMGSLIALESAARAQADCVAAVALLASAYPMKVSDTLLAATRDDEPRAIDMVNIWSHSGDEGGFSHKPSNPGPGFNIVWSNRRLMQRQKPGVMHIDFVACNAYAGGETAAAQLSAKHKPALFVLGERDAMTPLRAGLALAASITGSRVVTVPRAGHALMAEMPDVVLEALKSFLPASVRWTD